MTTNTNPPEIKQMKIEDVYPYVKKVEVKFRILEKGEKRDITSKRSGETHTLSNIVVADETASIILTLWDEDIDMVKEGKTYILSNGYVNVFKNSLRLAKGKYGIITEAENTIEEENVNTETDMSDYYIDAPRPRRTRRNTTRNKRRHKKSENQQDFSFKSTNNW